VMRGGMPYEEVHARDAIGDGVQEKELWVAFRNAYCFLLLPVL